MPPSKVLVLLCLWGPITTGAFVTPSIHAAIAVRRHRTPTWDSRPVLRMSPENGRLGEEHETPLVFPRSMLKREKLKISNDMGVGTMAWGDEKAGFVSDPKHRPRRGEFNPADLQGAYNALMNAGITFFDTSDVYGHRSARAGLSAEQLLGRFAEENSMGQPVIAAKYMPILWTKVLIGGPWRAGRRAVAKALSNTLERGGWGYVDLYQLHFPFPYVGGMEALAEGLAAACERGMCRSVGVSNFNAQQDYWPCAGGLSAVNAIGTQWRDLRKLWTDPMAIDCVDGTPLSMEEEEPMREFSEKLQKHGISLASNQIEFSLVNQDAKENGTLDECRRLGVVPMAHTPLAKGLATGVYTASNPTGGAAGLPKYNFQDLMPLAPIHTALVEVAKRVEGRLWLEAKEEQKRVFQEMQEADNNDDSPPPPPPKQRRITTTQVALNYVRAKGLVPLPGVKTKAHADEVVGCLGWWLQQDDVGILDDAYNAYKSTTGGKTVKRGRQRDPMKRQNVKFLNRSWIPNDE